MKVSQQTDLYFLTVVIKVVANELIFFKRYNGSCVACGPMILVVFYLL
jgi:hypothetical protein